MVLILIMVNGKYLILIRLIHIWSVDLNLLYKSPCTCRNCDQVNGNGASLEASDQEFLEGNLFNNFLFHHNKGMEE